MSFEKELKDVFDIDIWCLKDKYSSSNQTTKQDLSVVVDPIKKENLDSKFIYSNNVDSDRFVNIFVSEDLNLNFLRNVIQSLFFNSRVNIYETSKNLDQQGAINIYQKDFISDEFELLSVESKKYILQKLYQYADFSSR
ncbi:chloroquine resistance protein [Allofrancisella guangzhouensis]|uniref:Chloroquine resistance protein n=1 Tax=Allofrancisella guangzhouensis TaxID=594679 RepID=A0A0A8EAI1_9GAMM|nr:hypothetical protein [Allofrancisella guangzhouensis]AJC49171.1 hypothetical protein SD28_05755 [Allofrancisella guangzhouensis]MBK2026771.1 chloroquine resistance protein [Allofrancisella guangzhouensis]MBK2044443.1 chloroquine resistance protein [Allofrancisella guangzhouensis]MBK2045349.1 chloroquine resistance protein [Allofrancisella guangzhouensis]